jgi:hypothetical protein
MQKAFECIYEKILEAQDEKEASMEYRVTKVSEASEGFHACIVDHM